MTAVKLRTANIHTGFAPVNPRLAVVMAPGWNPPAGRLVAACILSVAPSVRPEAGLDLADYGAKRAPRFTNMGRVTFVKIRLASPARSRFGSEP